MSRSCHKQIRVRSRARYFAAALLLVAWTFAANSAAIAADASQASGADEAARHGVAAEVSYDSVAGDGFLGLRLKLDSIFEVPQIVCDEAVDPGCRTELYVGLQAPLRLRVYDSGTPQSDGFRAEDWDEASDYLRVIRTIEYGRSNSVVNARIGELGPISLGHGAIVRDYYNVVTTDHYQMGASADLNTVYGGVELLLDNVIDPAVMGGRAYIYPWAFVDTDSFLSRVALGLSVAADIQAPTQLQGDEDASIGVDDTLNPVVLTDQSTSLMGVDLEVALVDEESFSLVPYVDFTTHASLGSGLNAGAFVGAQLSDAVQVHAQLEYRRVGRQFLPTYFGPIYEIERLQFKGWGQAFPAPKVRAAASLAGAAVNGFYGSLGLNLLGALKIRAAWADHEGPSNQLFHLRATATPSDTTQIGLFYHKQYFDQFSDAFDLDGALVAAESRVGIWGPFYAIGRYGRMWKVAPDGRYESVNDWSLGAGASMGF